MESFSIYDDIHPAVDLDFVELFIRTPSNMFLFGQMAGGQYGWGVDFV